MNDRRRRPKRGVRLSDLPEHVVRDLPEFAPEDPLTVAVRGGRVTQRRVIEATKQAIDAPQPKPKKGKKRQPKHAKEVLQTFTFAAPAATVESVEKLAERVGRAAKRSIAQAVKKAVTDPASAAPLVPGRRSKRQMACDAFALQLRAHGFGKEFLREHRFAAEDAFEARQWRFDFALPKYKLAIEVEGLVVRMVRDINSGKPMRIVTGRHATITGMREDFAKYAAAEILGWHVIRVEQDMIQSKDAIGFVHRFVARWKYDEQQRKASRVAAKPRKR